VGLPHAATPQQMRDAVQAWLLRQARRLFTERLDHFAPQLQVRWQRLTCPVGRHALGQCQRRRLDPAELAADPLQQR
jgi:predicted metal-dependent hydrolase